MVLFSVLFPCRKMLQFNIILEELKLKISYHGIGVVFNVFTD